MIALFAVSGDLRAIVDIEAFAVILTMPAQRVQLLTRHRVGSAAHLLPLQRPRPAQPLDP